MIHIIKNYKWVIASSLICVIFGLLTFFTFINQSFITLNDLNLQILLIIDLVLLVIFFSLVIYETYKILKERKKGKLGSETSLRYILFFSTTTLLPSILIVYAVIKLFGYNGFLNANFNIYEYLHIDSIFGIKAILIAHVLLNAPFASRLFFHNLNNIPHKYLNSSARDIKNKMKVISFKKYISNYESFNLDRNIRAGIIIPDKDIIPGAKTLSPAYLIFENYEKILTWNRSLRFALAVCTLKKSFKNEI